MIEMSKIAQVIEMHVTNPDMIGGYITVLPDGSQILRGMLLPIDDVMEELYRAYKRAVSAPVSYGRFCAAYREATTWEKGVAL